MASEIKSKDIQEFGPRRSEKLRLLQESINEYYDDAFIPEISNTFKYILDTTNCIDAQVKAEILRCV